MKSLAFYLLILGVAATFVRPGNRERTISKTVNSRNWWLRTLPQNLSVN